MKGKFQESGQLRKELWNHKEAKNKELLRESHLKTLSELRKESEQSKHKEELEKEMMKEAEVGKVHCVNVYSEGIAFHIAFSVIFLITPCNRGSMSQGNPGDGTLNLYLCTGCNSSMCLFCGSLHLLRGAYINQIQKIFYLGVILLIKNKGFLHCRFSLSSLIARLRARRVKIYIVKPLIFLLSGRTL